MIKKFLEDLSQSLMITFVTSFRQPTEKEKGEKRGKWNSPNAAAAMGGVGEKVAEAAHSNEGG